MYAVVLNSDNRFEAVPAERIEERCKLLKLKHARAVAERLNADAPRQARDLAGDEVTQ